MDENTRENIREIIENLIMDKVEGYDPESKYKPFHASMFSEKDLANYSLIHSFSTSFGMSAYEQIAVELAKGAGFEAKRQYELDGKVDSSTEALISKIHKELKQGKRKPDRNAELKQIKESIEEVEDDQGGENPDKVVDVYIRKPNGKEYYFDITTVKPNKKEFQTLKRKLLTWMALRLSQDKSVDVYPCVSMPYNPHHPKEYTRWTKTGLYDDSQEMVGAEFWNFCANEDVYNELLEIFNEVGKDADNILEKTLPT